MSFNEWSSKGVELRILEAAETDLAMPKPRGPKMFGSAMPEPVREREDAYGYHGTRVRRTPSPGSLDRYGQTLDFVNYCIEDPLDRRFLWFWAIAKVNPGRSVNRFAQENGINNRTLRRRVTALCSRIADFLNRNHTVRLNVASGDLSDFLVREEPDEVPEPPSHPTYWNDDGRKPPRHQPVLYVQTAPGKRRAG